MRIALVTIHNSTNYGAVLQAYATQMVLARFGDVKVLNYDNAYLSKQMRLVRFECSVHGFLKVAHDVLRLPYRIRQLAKFKYFFDTKMFLTRKMSKTELSHGGAEGFDLYVCGSDQIWNPHVVNENGTLDDVYFLAFAPRGSKKISYASSMGHYEFLDQEEKQVFEWIKDFSAISLRESDGVEVISRLAGNQDVRHVLDPTLLLSAEEWRAAVNVQANTQSENYILVYSVPRSSLMSNAVKYYREKLGLKVIGIDPMLKPIAPLDTHVRTAGPTEFVNLFANAAFVITDSFHGVCFSINFGKPFVLVSPGKRSNRMVSLFNKLSLRDRMVTNEKEFDLISVAHDSLDETQPQLMALREESLSFIRAGVTP